MNQNPHHFMPPVTYVPGRGGERSVEQQEKVACHTSHRWSAHERNANKPKQSSHLMSLCVAAHSRRHLHGTSVARAISDAVDAEKLPKVKNVSRARLAQASRKASLHVRTNVCSLDDKKNLIRISVLMSHGFGVSQGFSHHF